MARSTTTKASSSDAPEAVTETAADAVEPAAGAPAMPVVGSAQWMTEVTTYLQWLTDQLGSSADKA
jgi:hypothetical protein